eukprot:11136460-Ditylum_brightwellii.AAC.1
MPKQEAMVLATFQGNNKCLGGGKEKTEQAKEAGAWLTTMLNCLNESVLSVEEFCNNLSLRYGLTLLGLQERLKESCSHVEQDSPWTGKR